MNLHILKKNLRQELKQRRVEISANARTIKSQKIINTLKRIDDYIDAKSVFCYVSLPDEVDTYALIDHCITRGINLSVPRVASKTEMIAVKLGNRHELIPNAMGILTSGSDMIETGPFDIAITPGLGFSDKGERLGYGRGYYDRWFSKNNVKIKIALAFDSQLLDKVPTEARDEPMDMIVTEKQIIDLRSGRF